MTQQTGLQLALGSVGSVDGVGKLQARDVSSSSTERTLVLEGERASKIGTFWAHTLRIAADVKNFGCVRMKGKMLRRLCE
jgi:hypothetical protein